MKMVGDSQTSEKILIVDDEEIIFEEVAEALSSEGYHCLTASNVDAAINIVRTFSDIKLIVTDLRMPNKTGAELIEEVVALYGQKIKIIVMSGHEDKRVEGGGMDTAEYSISGESYAFLRKPLNVERLLSTVHNTLSSNLIAGGDNEN